ncbi:MAG: DUF3775 domain-containing protein [Rhodobacteraceae bacterium]|nr:DUF3775 domain-containing protein [Paracoccaceae bacterium]
MPEIHAHIVAQVILLARETSSRGVGNPAAEAELREFIAAQNEDDQYALVAIAWIGRESFAPQEWDEAVRTAREEATTSTEDYLTGMTLLADYLEDGLEALGISATDAEEDLL